MLSSFQNTDALYWYRLKKGDAAALGFLYDKYIDKLFLAALRMTDNRELAKDAVQEVFIELWKYRQTISEIHYSQSYLIKVLNSVLIKKLKKENTTVYLELEESLISPDPDIETLLIGRDDDKEKQTKLNYAFSKLSKRQKLVVELHFYKGLSYERIAEKLNINYQSVNNLCFRSILRLRNLMICFFYFIILLK